MAGYQDVTLVGNLGRDPEMQYTPTGKAVTNFSLAVTEPGKESPMWVKITAWEKLAEIANQHLKKGNPVLVKGRLEYDPQTGGPQVWNGRDGSVNASFELTAFTIRFLPSGGGRGQQRSSGPQRQQTAQGRQASGPPPRDDIPF